MTENIRHEVQVDTDIAAAYEAVAKAQQVLAQREVSVLYAAGARKVYRGRRQVWDMTVNDALKIVGVEAAQDMATAALPYKIREAMDTFGQYHLALNAVKDAAKELTFQGSRYQGWSRFFLVQGGHIHSSMHCSTCNNGENATSFGWLPELSGLGEQDAVEAHGALLCTVCFPSAPVEWTNAYEVAAAAKKAAQCPGKRDYDAPSRTGYYSGNWATCDTCHGHVTVTSTGKLRAHKPQV